MPGSVELSAAAQQWVNVVLIWIGLGTVAGLFAKLVLPVREPTSAAGTLVIGVLGSTAGLAVLSGLSRSPAVNPISPLGLVAACAGAFALMLVYHALYLWLTHSEMDDEA
ncbi:MAG: GlsB/YeaQ/YmgE family stress response membrane protein [Pirellulales bacterium]